MYERLLSLVKLGRKSNNMPIQYDSVTLMPNAVLMFERVIYRETIYHSVRYDTISGTVEFFTGCNDGLLLVYTLYSIFSFRS